jgi:3-phosphoshikimate 1-carboxyvinyltransferase
MGAHITVENEHIFGRVGGEPVGNLVVTASELTATEIKSDEVPWLIDEIPILIVAMARANGTSRIRGAEELRVKESDRLTAIARLLDCLGVRYTEYPDGIDIEGKSEWAGGELASGGDHRIAMSAAVAGLLCEKGMKVADTACVATSFPGFAQELQKLGASIA